MITYHRTSILTSQAQTVVNTVNTVGVMGKGLASEYKSRYPEMFKAYREFCKNGMLDIGKLWLWKEPDQWILNFPTKKHWRQPSKLEYVEAGLKKFSEQYEKRGITEIAFPRLGCGNGGLEWDIVRRLMEKYLSNLPINIYIHDYEKTFDLPEHQEQQAISDLFSSPYSLPNKSFDQLQASLKSLIECQMGEFRTVKNGKVFNVEIGDQGSIILKYANRRRIIDVGDLYYVWDMLLKGPVTKDQVSGTAWESAYWLFSIFSRLPFIRPIQVASKNGDETLAIELIGETSVKSVHSQSIAG